MSEQNQHKNVNTRALITEMLMEIEQGKEYSHILLRNVLDKYNFLEEYDKAFIKRVLDGTLERRIQIDYVLDMVSNVRTEKMKPFIRALMRMSVYQILFMDKVPDSAACNEAVKLAEKKKFANLKGYINGVLRNISRQKDSIRYPDEKSHVTQSLSVRYSMPEFIVDLLLRDYGREKTKSILNGLLAEHGLCIRMKETLTEEQERQVKDEWEKHGIIYTPHPYLSYAYILKNTEQISKRNGFTNGFYTVQDLSSMLVCEVADIHPGDIIIDVCAAPGGKCLHASDKLAGSGLVDARDVSDYKVTLIEENKKRLQADNVTVKVWDATIPDESVIKSADIVIADVPCSGIGVIGKKPDIKYNLSQQALRDLEELQKRIMDTVWQYVKPGGTLIYSTCTMRREENQDMIAYLVEHYPFKTESLVPFLPKKLQSDLAKDGYIQLFPDENMDGFFIARLKRMSE